MTPTRLATSAAALVAAVGLVAGLTRAADEARPQQKQSAVAATAVELSQPSRPSSNPLDLLAPYVGGEWKCDGKWEGSNEPLVAREVFTWGPGKKFVNVKTFVTGPDGEYQRYEAMYGVKDGKLVSWSFNYDGEAQTSDWVVEGKKWSTSNPMALPGGATATLHQSVELVEPDKFRWVVETEQDGKRTKLFDGHWVRQGGAGGTAAVR